MIADPFPAFDLPVGPDEELRAASDGRRPFFLQGDLPFKVTPAVRSIGAPVLDDFLPAVKRNPLSRRPPRVYERTFPLSDPGIEFPLVPTRGRATGDREHRAGSSKHATPAFVSLARDTRREISRPHATLPASAVGRGSKTVRQESVEQRHHAAKGNGDHRSVRSRHVQHPEPNAKIEAQ